MYAFEEACLSLFYIIKRAGRYVFQLHFFILIYLALLWGEDDNDDTDEDIDEVYIEGESTVEFHIGIHCAGFADFLNSPHIIDGD